jgi:hypothetical protein
MLSCYRQLLYPSALSAPQIRSSYLSWTKEHAVLKTLSSFPPHPTLRILSHIHNCRPSDVGCKFPSYNVRGDACGKKLFFILEFAQKSSDCDAAEPPIALY